MKITRMKPIPRDDLENMGLTWHTDPDSSDYISDELIHVSEEEVDRYYEAANEVYEMYIQAAEYVIENNLFYDLDIPNAMVDMIKQSFSEDIHWHIYGRFDFAGGLDGRPIKLLEFNADTPTMLYESAAIQWALLRYNGFDEESQFNNIFEAISNNFKRLITLEEDISSFNEMYEGWRILFSSVRGNDEEERTTRFLQEMASEAGFRTNFSYVDEVALDEAEGVFFQDENYEFWFKLLPWENICIEEPEMASIMRSIMENKASIFLNPAYTAIFQSKRILKVLWDLFPNHKLLLPASYDKLDRKQVRKNAFGREGANVAILDKHGNEIESKGGIYSSHKEVFQEFYELNSHNGKYYQANVFFSYEACGLGYRSGGAILDNYSKFVSHIVTSNK